MIYPWQEQYWEFIKKAYNNQRLSHAYLFCGDSGMGQYDFSFHLARSLLCSSTDQLNFCGDCPDCKMVQSHTHPDLLLLTPDHNMITVDQIRLLHDKLHQTSKRNQYKIAIIHPLSKLNASARAAFLKVLEEPPGSALMLLVEPFDQLMPKTITSRCQSIAFRNHDIELSKSWLHSHLSLAKGEVSQLLSLSLNSPLRAVDFKEANTDALCKKLIRDMLCLIRFNISPLTLAKQWSDYDSVQLLWLLYIIILDLFMLSLNGSIEFCRIHTSHIELNQLQKMFSTDRLIQLSHQLVELSHLSENQSINRLLLFEKTTLMFLAAAE